MEEKDEDEGKEVEALVPGRIWHCSRRVCWKRDTREGKTWRGIESTGERRGHMTI